jgi:hypothetical protein
VLLTGDQRPPHARAHAIAARVRNPVIDRGISASATAFDRILAESFSTFLAASEEARTPPIPNPAATADEPSRPIPAPSAGRSLSGIPAPPGMDGPPASLCLFRSNSLHVVSSGNGMEPGKILKRGVLRHKPSSTRSRKSRRACLRCGAEW